MIKFKLFLPYLQLHQTALRCGLLAWTSSSAAAPSADLSHGQTLERLTGGRGVSCEEGGPVNQWAAAAQGTEQVVLVVRWRAHGQEVVFTRLSFFHVWTPGRTGGILAWLQPKIFISLRRAFHSHFLQGYRTHLGACCCPACYLSTVWTPFIYLYLTTLLN